MTDAGDVAITSHNYIAIEGPIGAGKSMLARLLAERFRGRAILEQNELNPFVEKFYQDPAAHAFQTQIFFLFSRYNQLKKEIHPDLFSQFIVSDFTLDKDFLFASVNLTEEEFNLYRQIYAMLHHQSLRPDIVVYLYCNADVLYERLRKASPGTGITREYLTKICRSYHDFYCRYDESALLVINAEHIDLATRPEFVYKIAGEIENLNRGRKYYNPA